jgi:hypothetical protein
MLDKKWDEVSDGALAELGVRELHGGLDDSGVNVGELRAQSVAHSREGVLLVLSIHRHSIRATSQSRKVHDSTRSTLCLASSAWRRPATDVALRVGRTRPEGE